MARTRRPRVAHPECLELRILPTVKVNFNPGSGLLKITGDNAANEITLDGLGANGAFQVFIDGTLFDDFSGVADIRANLKGGDDRLLINAITITGALSAKLGKGADEFDADSVINLGSGPDGEVGFGSINVDFGNNPGDFLDIDDGFGVGGKAVFKRVADVELDGDGSGPESQAGLDVLFFGGLEISLSGHGDTNSDGFEIDFDNANAFTLTRITGSISADRIDLTSCKFGQLFFLDLGDGDDSLSINESVPERNIFNDAEFDGGAGSDTLDDLNNTYNTPPVITGFEIIL